MTLKFSMSVIAIALTFYAFYPYIRSILAEQTKPHVFSWVIWGMTTLVVFFAQLADDGGVGAWPTGISGVITFYVAALAYAKKADDSITRLDWVFFIVAITSLPFWYVTNDPLWAVLILTAVDLAGFGPTFRQAFKHPHLEQLLFFNLMALRNAISIVALEHFSVTTILFPAATGLACVVFVVMVFLRRK